MSRLAIAPLVFLLFVSDAFSLESLDKWILQQIRADEKVLSDAARQTAGTSFELLQYSRTYVPFFLEPPSGVIFESQAQQAAFKAFVDSTDDTFLPGGYVFRMLFDTAPPLYALSAGDQSGGFWRNLELSSDFKIEPDQVWGGSGDDYLYATLIADVPPRLIVYGRSGEIKRDEAFDVSAADFDRRVQAAIEPYTKNGKPVLEMMMLSEYVENPDGSWRTVDTSAQFNLRNQQQRQEEEERRSVSRPQTRQVIIEALASRIQAGNDGIAGAESLNIEPKKEAAGPKGTRATAAAQSNASTSSVPPASAAPSAPAESRLAAWIFAGAISALLVVVVLALRRRA